MVRQPARCVGHRSTERFTRQQHQGKRLIVEKRDTVTRHLLDVQTASTYPAIARPDHRYKLGERAPRRFSVYRIPGERP